jgi:hypothetical protein
MRPEMNPIENYVIIVQLTSRTWQQSGSTQSGSIEYQAPTIKVSDLSGTPSTCWKHFTTFSISQFSKKKIGKNSSHRLSSIRHVLDTQ